MTAALLLVCVRASGSSATLWPTLVVSVSLVASGDRVKVPILCHHLHKVELRVAVPAISVL